jgi:hypothetical protein
MSKKIPLLKIQQRKGNPYLNVIVINKIVTHNVLLLL